MLTVIITHDETFDPSVITSIGGEILDPLEAIDSIITAHIPEDHWYEVGRLPGVQNARLSSHIKGEQHAGLGNFAQLDSKWAYHINQLRGTEYWNRGITGKGVKIAIFTSGIGRHYSVPMAGGIDLVSEKYLGLAPDPFRDDVATDQSVGHELQCASCIVGRPYKGTGGGVLAGIAPEVELYSLKVMYGELITPEAEMLAGFNWCITNGINIVSISMGFGYELIPEMMAAITAMQNAGIIWVCSSGNSGGLISPGFPQDVPGFVVVSGSGDGLTKYASASYGPNVMFCAPSTTVQEYAITGNGTTWSSGITAHGGTSFGTPFVAGVIALYMQAYPGLTSDQILQKMIDNCLKIQNTTGWSQYYGHGVPQPSTDILNMPVLGDGNGLKLFGNGEYVDLGNNTALNLTTDFTLVATVKQKYFNSGHILAKVSSDASKNFYSLYLGLDGIGLDYVSGGVTKTAHIPMSIADNRKHTVAITVTANTLTIYLDGQALPTTYALTAIDSDTASHLYIGSNMKKTSGSFSGMLYDAKVYNRALSAADILNDYNSKSTTVGMLAHYAPNGTETTTLTDMYGTNNGTLYGTKSSSASAVKASIPVTPVAPPSASTSAVTSSSVTVTWTASTSYGVQYEVYVNNEKFPRIVTSSTSYAVTGLPANTLHTFKIVAVDKRGSKSSITTQISTLVDNNVTAISGIAVRSMSDNALTIIWNSNADTNFDHYEVWYAMSGTPFALATQLNNTVGVYSNKRNAARLVGLNKGEVYDIWVMAVNKAGIKSTPTKYTTAALSNTQTTIMSDTFSNRTSTNGLGMPEVGSQPYSYSDAVNYPYGIDGNHTVYFSNLAAASGSYFTQPFYYPVNTSQYAVEATMADGDDLNGGGGVGISYRLPVATATATNSFMLYGYTWTQSYTMAKFVAGTYTELLGNNQTTFNNGDRWRVETYTDGTVITIINDVVQQVFVDTALVQASSNVGFHLMFPGARIDNIAIYGL